MVKEKPCAANTGGARLFYILLKIILLVNGMNQSYTVP